MPSFRVRLFLFSGLLLHKLVWEVLRHRGGDSSPPRRPPRSLARLLKLAKVGGLVFLMAQSSFLNVLPITAGGGRLRRAGVTLFSAGLVTALLGRLHLGKNWSNIEDATVKPDQELVTAGIYRYIRHPIYFGDVLLLLGFELALGSWLFCGVLLLLLVAVRRVRVEEAQLREKLPDYASYQERTKRFVPFVF